MLLLQQNLQTTSGTTHATTGALANSGATLSGASARFRSFTTTGVLANSGATIAGTSDHTAPGGVHPTSGALSAGGATLAGTSAHIAIHGTSGALVNAGATIAGTSSNFTTHATSGALLADAAILSGTALHSFAVSHATTGALVGWGAELNGSAVNGTAAVSQHFSGGYLSESIQSKKKPKPRKKIYEIDPITGEKKSYWVVDELLPGAETKAVIDSEIFSDGIFSDEEKRRYRILAAAALLTAH